MQYTQPLPSGSVASRRSFLKRALSAGAGLAATAPVGARTGRIAAFDHVAVPMRNTEAMAAFYRRLGFDVMEGPRICSVHMAHQKINFHRPEFWQGGTFTLRAAAAEPPCGDFCFIWEGGPEALTTRLREASAEVIEGPVDRQGGRDGGSAVGSSVYVRDPDRNLLEFIIYP